MQLLHSVTLGQFVPGDSVVHRLDPRARLGVLIIGMVAIFSCHHLFSVALVGMAAVAAAALAGISVRWFLSGLRTVALLVAVTLVANVMFGRADGPTVAVGGFAVSSEAMRHGLLMSLRLVSLFLLTSLFTLTTSPIRLTDALESVLSPLRLVGVRTSDLSMMVSIALRFIPTLIDTTERIMKAQLSRGARFNEGSLMSRSRAMIPVLVPLFVQAFHAADVLAEAMEARCYRGGQGRTRLVTLRCGLGDLAAVSLCGLLALSLGALDAQAWPVWL